MISFKKTMIAIFTFALFLCNQDGLIEKQNEAIAYARKHSGTESTRDWNDIYWDHTAEFLTSKEYNVMMRLDRLDSLQYISSQEAWTWDTDSSRSVFKKKRIQLNKFSDKITSLF